MKYYNKKTDYLSRLFEGESYKCPCQSLFDQPSPIQVEQPIFVYEPVVQKCNFAVHFLFVFTFSLSRNSFFTIDAYFLMSLLYLTHCVDPNLTSTLQLLVLFSDVLSLGGNLF